MRKNNPEIERLRRISYASILATTPETFDVITENNICLFHGTNSNALLSMLRYGINSTDRSKQNGIPVTTGEEWTRPDGGRDFVSLTDDPYIAGLYSELEPSKNAKDGNGFSVVIGISAEAARKLDFIQIHRSDVREIGVLDNVPPECISFIGVPESKVDFVRRLVNNDKIKVAAVEPSKRFYRRALYYNGDIIFDDKKARSVMHEQKKHDTAFSIDEIKALTLGRIKSKIQESALKIKSLKDKFFEKGKGAYERN